MANEDWLDDLDASFAAPDSGNTWNQYQVDIDRISMEEGVDPRLVTSVIRAESGGDRLAVSNKGASGLMQLMPGTASEMGVTDSTDPLQNIRGGTRYLKRQLDANGGDIGLALAAYNAGPGNVKKYGGIPPFKETQDYVKKVTAYYENRDYTPEQPKPAKKTAAPAEKPGNWLDELDASFQQPNGIGVRTLGDDLDAEFANVPPPGQGFDTGLPPIPLRRPTEQGRLSSAGGSFMRGFGSILASVPKAIGENAVQLANKFGDDPIWGNPDRVTPEETTAYQAGEAIEKWFNKFAVNPEYRDEFWTSQVAQGAGSMFGFLSGGIVGNIAKIPALVTTMGLGAAATSVEGVDDYLSTLAADEQADPAMRAQVSNLNAILGTTEGLPITQMLNRLDHISGGGVKRIIKEGFKGGIEELTQEVLQSVGQNAIASRILSYDPERGLFTGTANAGAVGFTLGYAMNTLAAMIGSRRAGNTGAPAEDETAPPPADGAAPLAASDIIGDEIDMPSLSRPSDETAGQSDLDVSPADGEGGARGTQDQTGPSPGVGAAPGAFSEQLQEPAQDEDIPAPKISYFDNRLKREIYRTWLSDMGDELQVGGDVSYTTDDFGTITGRTPSVNPDWYKSMMEDPDYQLSGGVKGVWGAIEKALSGDRLGVRQSRVIEAMLDNMQSERSDAANLDYARSQLQLAREARAAAKMPDAPDWLFEEEDYPDDADGLKRTFMELQASAHDMSPELGDQVDELMGSQQDDAAIITAITKLMEGYTSGRQSEISTQVDQAAQAQAGLPDTGQEPLPGEPAAAGGPGGLPARDGYVEPGAEVAPQQPVAQAPPDSATPITPVSPVSPASGDAVRTGRDDKYDVDVSMSKNDDGGYTITESGDSAGNPKVISSGSGGIYLGGNILNMEGEFVEPLSIVQGGGKSVGTEETPWKGTREEKQRVIDLVAEIEFNRSIGNMEVVEDLENQLADIVSGKETEAAQPIPAKRTEARTPAEEPPQAAQAAPAAPEAAAGEEIEAKPVEDRTEAFEEKEVSISELEGVPGNELRRSPEEMARFTEKIKSGEISPPIIVETVGGKFVNIQEGNHTLAARKALGEDKVKVRVIERAKDRRKKKHSGIKQERRDIGRDKRRRGWALRKKIDAMAPVEKDAAIKELRRIAQINKLTGLGDRGLWEDEILPAALERGDWIVSMDADSLGWVNDNIGNEAGDKLLVEVAKALKTQLGDTVFHISGDEFWSYGSDKDAIVKSLRAAQEALKTASLESEGSKVTGFAFSYGITKDATSADRAMKADKKAREAAGERVAKTSRPSGVVLRDEADATALLSGKAKEHPGKKADPLKAADERIAALEQLKLCINS